MTKLKLYLTIACYSIAAQTFGMELKDVDVNADNINKLIEFKKSEFTHCFSLSTEIKLVTTAVKLGWNEPLEKLAWPIFLHAANVSEAYSKEDYLSREHKEKLDLNDLEKNLKKIQRSQADSKLGKQENVSNALYHHVIHRSFEKILGKENQTPTYSFTSSKYKISELAWSNDEQLLAFGLFKDDSATNKIAIAALPDLKIIKKIKHPHHLTHVTLSSQNSHIAAANELGILYIWEIDSSAPPKIIDWGKGKIISQLAFNKNSTQITALYHETEMHYSQLKAKENGSSLIIFDLESGTPIRKLYENSNVLRFAMNETMLRTAQKRNKGQPAPKRWDSVIDIETGTEVPADAQQKQHLSIAHRAHHPDGQHRITRSAHRLKLSCNKQNHFLFGCTLFPNGNALFSPKGSFLAIGGFCHEYQNNDFTTLLQTQPLVSVYRLPSIEWQTIIKELSLSQKVFVLSVIDNIIKKPTCIAQDDAPKSYNPFFGELFDSLPTTAKELLSDHFITN